MNRMNCPECGYTIEDSAVRCPHCRFPIGKFSESGKADGMGFAVSQEEFSALKSEITSVSPWYSGIKSKRDKIFMIVFIAAIIVVCMIILAMFILSGSGEKISEPQIKSFSMSRKMKLNGSTVIRLSTDCKDPFAIAVRNNYNGEIMYSFMEDGSGSLYIDNDNTTKKHCEPIGYFSGYKIKREDITVTEIKKYKKNDEDLLDCYVTASVKLNSSESGILLFDSVVLYTEMKNCKIDIYNGEGSCTWKISDIDHRISHDCVNLEPLFFIPCESISETDYSVTESITVNSSSDDLKVNLNGKASLSTGTDGVIFYHYNLSDGKSLIKRGNGMCFSQNRVCDIDNDILLFEKSKNVKNYEVFFHGILRSKPLPEIK